MGKNPPAMQEFQVQPLGRGEWLHTPVFLPGKFQGQRRVTFHGVAKSWSQMSMIMRYILL